MTSMALFRFLAFPICLQGSRTQGRVATRMDAHPLRSCCEHPTREATALPGQRGAHRSSSLKRVRLCFWMCSSRTCPRRSSIWRARFSPCCPPWLSQNTGSVCSDLSSIFCRQPDWRTFTTDSGNLDEGPPSAEQKGKAKVISESSRERRSQVARACTAGAPRQCQLAKSQGPCPLTSHQGPFHLLSCENGQGIKPSEGSHPTENLLSRVKCLLLCLANARKSPGKAELRAKSGQEREAPRPALPARAREGLGHPYSSRAVSVLWGQVALWTLGVRALHPGAKGPAGCISSQLSQGLHPLPRFRLNSLCLMECGLFKSPGLRSHGLQQGHQASVPEPPPDPFDPHPSMPSSSRKFSLSSGC